MPTHTSDHLHALVLFLDVIQQQHGQTLGLLPIFSVEDEAEVSCRPPHATEVAKGRIQPAHVD